MCLDDVTLRGKENVQTPCTILTNSSHKTKQKNRQQSEINFSHRIYGMFPGRASRFRNICHARYHRAARAICHCGLLAIASR